MLTTLPENLDPWKMVSARRSFSGNVPIAAMQRLPELLVDAQGGVDYELDFGVDQQGIKYIEVTLKTSLQLECQRTLKPFAYPVDKTTRLGLITADHEQAALPEGYEPLLVEDGFINPLDVIEDELLLAMPLVPISPDSEWPEAGVEATAPDAPAEEKTNPFAVLQDLKSK